MKFLFQFLSVACLTARFAVAGEIDVSEWKWFPVWSRAAGAASSAMDDKVLYEGRPTMRIEHRGDEDWSLHPVQRFDVKEGDIYELSAWVKVAGSGRAELSVVTRAEKDRVIDWSYGSKSIGESKDGRLIRARFVVPHGVATIHPRLIGDGPATIWVEGFRLQGKGSVEAMRRDAGEEMKFENDAISVSFLPRDTTFAVTDKRTGQTWTQKPANHNLVVTGGKVSGRKMRIDLLDVGSGAKFEADVRLESKAPEFTVAISGDGEMESSLAFPQPFVTATNTYLVVPMNEGISYPVADPTIHELTLVAYGGHGICMAFFGATDGERGQMAILETADDAMIRIARRDGVLAISPEWQSQKGKFGYERKIRYAFLDRGGHVAMCKRYREYAKETGKLKTFTEKRRENPNIDLLIGAVNTWFMDRGSDAVQIAREMKDAGIDRILWSAAGSAETIKAMNEMPGVLTSRYDIYQDLMDPAIVTTKLKWTHGDWTQAAWPNDINLLANGDWRKGWGVDGNDGVRYYCAVICDRQALKYARERVPAELALKPYRCRFIDTTTAAPWYECYDPRHPQTRTDSREFKMKLLSYMSHDMKLVTGCETGHDAAVPFCDYFEGMLSLGPYRVPDAGRKMQVIWTNVPEQIAKFQVGHAYRLPLWELVYHDCCVAQWYWGDYNNKLPAVWDKRDLFNVLYGTPPMFMFNRKLWNENKDRFARSYKAIGPVARATGYSEMLDHKFLTPDRNVQQTRFADGTIVTVNFGDAEFRAPDGAVIAPMGYVTARKP